jgi:hypothetical protein
VALKSEIELQMSQDYPVSAGWSLDGFAFQGF